MAKLQCDFFSPSLMRTVTVKVVLPTDKMPLPGRPAAEDGPFKTLYLLHGIFGNYTDWGSGTNVERWAQDKGLCLVMPSGDNHFYVDNPRASALYGSFIGRDLMDFTRKSFPLSPRREDTFIGGLSMGGYGAIVNGLKHPETFGAVCGLSSALILDRAGEMTEYTDSLMTNRGFYEAVFGDLAALRGGEHDYDALARQVAARADKPRFYLACGTEDGLLAPNQAYRDLLAGLGYDVTYEEGPGGHDWDYWNTTIRKVLDWLPLTEEKALSSGNVGV